MAACDYCDHIHVCNYLNNLSGQPWPGAQHDLGTWGIWLTPFR